MHAMKQVLSFVFVIALAATVTGQDGDPDLSTILQRVRERVTRHYLDLQSLAWTDTVKVEAPGEKPRELVYDSIVRLQEPVPGDNAVPFYIRDVSELRAVNGKPVKKNELPKSTDPRAANMGTLSFLLSEERSRKYAFSYAGPTDLSDRKVLRIDINSPQTTPPKVTWDDTFVFFSVRYHFQVSAPFTKGVLWVDPETYEVLQLEWRSDPFEFQRTAGSEKIKYESGLKVQFQSMPLAEPNQTIAVPVSLEFTRTITREDVRVSRQTHTLSNYKRFTGDAKVISVEGATK